MKTILLLSILIISVQLTSCFINNLNPLADLNNRNTFCQDGRSGKQYQQDDLVTQLFYNGSYLDHMEKIDLDAINGVLLDSSRARQAVESCSMRQWGYNDDMYFQLSNGPMENSAKCKLEIEKLHAYMNYLKMDNDIKQNNSQELYIQLSSFGRVPIGSPHHTSIWVGDYVRCMGLTSTRYCYGMYKTFPRQRHTQKLKDRKLPLDMTIKQVGLCLPRSCTSNIANSTKHLSQIEEMALFNLVEGFGITSKKFHRITDVYCPPAPDSEWNYVTRGYLSKFLIIFAILWIFNLTYCTISSKPIYDQSSKSTEWRNDFNLISLWISLFRSNKSDKELSSLDVFKVIGMIIIVLNHTQLVQLPIMRDYEPVRSDGLQAVLFQAQYNVNMFFITSSFLFSYMVYKYNLKLDFMNLIMNRYIRCAPMYLIFYAYVKQFYHTMGSGPFWDYGISPQSEHRQCMTESWLVPIFMLANYIIPTSHCLLTGWYIALDFQLFCLSLIIIYLYKISKSCARFTCIFMFAFTFLFHFWNFQTSEAFSHEQLYEDSMIFGPHVVTTRLAFDYATPMGRIGTTCLGLLLGDLLFEEHKRINIMKNDLESSNNLDAISRRSNTETGHSKTLLRAIFSLGFVSCSHAYMAPLYPQYVKYRMFGVFSKGLGYTVTRMSNELGWFLMLYSVVMSRQIELQSEKVNINDQPLSNWSKFINSRYWSILSRIQYCVLIVNLTVIKVMVQSSPDYIQNSGSMSMGLTTIPMVIVCYVVSAILYICVEMPINRALKRLMSGKHR